MDYKERRRRELSGEGSTRRQTANKSKYTSNGILPNDNSSGDAKTRRRRKKDAVSNGVFTKATKESNHKTIPIDKINIVETSPNLLKEDNSEKENKQKVTTSNKNTNRKIQGNKIQDKLNRFETGIDNKKKTNTAAPNVPAGSADKTPFQRHYGPPFRTNTEPLSFRRSYRLPRKSAIEETGASLRRSLRGTQRVKDSIAKLEGKDVNSNNTTTPSVTGTANTKSSDGSKISQLQRRLERAAQALERHKDRIRRTPSKSTPSKTTKNDAGKSTPKKQGQTTTDEIMGSKKKQPDTSAPTVEETTTISEITTPSKEKVQLVIKEKHPATTEPQEDVAKKRPSKTRNLSVGEAVALFSTEDDKPQAEAPEETKAPLMRSRRRSSRLKSDQSQTDDPLKSSSEPDKSLSEITINSSESAKASTVPPQPSSEPDKSPPEPVRSPSLTKTADEAAIPENKDEVQPKTKAIESRRERRRRSRRSSADTTSKNTEKLPEKEVIVIEKAEPEEELGTNVDHAINQFQRLSEEITAGISISSKLQSTAVTKPTTPIKTEILFAESTSKSVDDTASFPAKVEETLLHIVSEEPQEQPADISQSLSDERDESTTKAEPEAPDTEAKAEVLESLSNEKNSSAIEAEDENSIEPEAEVLEEPSGDRDLGAIDAEAEVVIGEDQTAVVHEALSEDKDLSAVEAEVKVSAFFSGETTQQEEPTDIKVGEEDFISESCFEEPVAGSIEEEVEIAQELSVESTGVQPSSDSEAVPKTASTPEEFTVNTQEPPIEKSATEKILEGKTEVYLYKESENLEAVSVDIKSENENRKFFSNPEGDTADEVSEEEKDVKDAITDISEVVDNIATAQTEDLQENIEAPTLESNARLLLRDLVLQNRTKYNITKESIATIRNESTGVLSDAGSDDMDSTGDAWLYESHSDGYGSDELDSWLKNGEQHHQPRSQKRHNERTSSQTIQQAAKPGSATPTKSSAPKTFASRTHEPKKKDHVPKTSTPKTATTSNSTKTRKKKTKTSKKTVKSNAEVEPVAEVNIGNVKSALEKKLQEDKTIKTSTDYSKTELLEQREITVNNMLNMWEQKNQKDKDTASSTSKQIELEGITPVKKVRGAKSLFENLANQQSPHVSSSSDTNTPTMSPPARKLRTKLPAISNGVSSDSSSEDERDVSRREQRNKSQLSDLVEYLEGDNMVNVRNVKAMWESQVANRSRKNDKEDQAAAAPEFAKNKSAVSRSFVQSKISARRSKGRRSMTQPISFDDVQKAAKTMDQDKSDVSDDEKIVSVKDRLNFFSQIAEKHRTTVIVKDDRRRRFGTLPVDWEAVKKAENNIAFANNSTAMRREKADRELPMETDQLELTNKFASEKALEIPDMAKSDGKFSKRKREQSVSSVSSGNQSLSPSSSEDEMDSKENKGITNGILSSSRSSIGSEKNDRKSSNASSISDISSEGNIPFKDRLKALERNEKKTSSSKDEKFAPPKKVVVAGSLGDRMKKLSQNQEKWKGSAKPDKPDKSIGKLTERVASIKRESENWKAKKGKQNDSTQFSVHAKIAKREQLGMIKVLPATTAPKKVLLPQDHVTEEQGRMFKSGSMKALSKVEELANKGLEDNVIKKSEVNTTLVPQMDDEEFENFFVGTQIAETPIVNGIVNGTITLPEISPSKKLSDIGKLKSARPSSRKRQSSKKNPLKALKHHEAVKDSYDEERTNISRLEQQRLASRGYGANFTAAALAGLAAKADLSGVKLKSAAKTPMPSSDDLKPFHSVNLFRLKGRKHVQVVLVEPKASSLCSDDAFLLAAEKHLFGWFGEFCNVIERAKVNEMADYIIRRNDLGVRTKNYVKIEEHERIESHKDFWKLLGGHTSWQTEISPDADANFETVAESAIKTYVLKGDKMEPFKEAWGQRPKMEMLKSDGIYTLDFGSEVYCWNGKASTFAERRLGARLSSVLFKKDVDYSDIGASPYHDDNVLKGPRPSWALFGRINENLETCAFQEKFANWSNIHREIGEREEVLRETNRGAALAENKTRADIKTDLVSCDASKILQQKPESKTLMLSGYNLWKGAGQLEDEDGRLMDVITTANKMFHIDGKEVNECEDIVLFRGDTYILQWKYVISSTGKFNKSTKNSVNHDANGRTRVCNFVFVGANSTINDKGASALIATNIDMGGEEGPQIVVQENSLPPVFLSNFNGCCLLMDGKKGKRNDPFEWKLFALRMSQSNLEDVVLQQINCNTKHLRSRSSFILLNVREAKAIVWHGKRSPKNVRKLSESAANLIAEKRPTVLNFRTRGADMNVATCEEGSETETFWEAISSIRKKRGYFELNGKSDSVEPSTRAFHFQAESHEFIAKEITPLESDSNFPIIQDQLYEIEQPALVLLHSPDSPHSVHLWQGWLSNDASSSMKRLWEVSRRLAMETTLEFCKTNEIKSEPQMQYCGHETDEFVNLFPMWEEKTDVNKVDRQTSKLCKVSEALQKLSKLTYTIEELRSEVLPDGVDARHLETYLTTEDFEKLFDMSREEFYKLPPWKQSKLRKSNNFF